MLEEHIHSNSVIIESFRYLGYFGDVAFAASGALVAARKQMDIIGYMLLGSITGRLWTFSSGQILKSCKLLSPQVVSGTPRRRLTKLTYRLILNLVIFWFSAKRR